ncbi:hypothetical protein PCANC_25152 [Puccinia coronata f. sp. avenae]|uniref:C2H2-type domain-containing protein n=1 Tax=Puccinia coronata f. sp. avenae TaxID=200324 RepID=A0A2N5S3S9_9BASI|nr:hypothetical protein PCANC_25152 [Puccinia coronata f. sp. avenae]
MSDYECQPCGRTFRLLRHYQEHMIHSAAHHYCAQCDRDFVDEGAIQQHLRYSDNHMVCQWCPTTVGSLRAHNRTHHEQCNQCSRWCEDSVQLHHHFRQDHWDVYCTPCQRLFANPKALRMHCSGAIHTPKSLRCPGRGCERSFISRSALIQHFEADTCASGYNLADVDRDFSQHVDTGELVVTKKLIFPAPRLEIPVDQQGRNSCRACAKSFRSRGELFAHFKSPKHKNRGHKPYICPWRQCGKDRFYSLSDVLLHMDTTDCGEHYNEQVNGMVDELLSIVAHDT